MEFPSPELKTRNGSETGLLVPDILHLTNLLIGWKSKRSRLNTIFVAREKANYIKGLFSLWIYMTFNWKWFKATSSLYGMTNKGIQNTPRYTQHFYKTRQSLNKFWKEKHILFCVLHSKLNISPNCRVIAKGSYSDIKTYNIAM